MVSPPTHMTTPDTAHLIIFSILATVLAGLLVASLFEWRRTGRPTMTLLIFGGLVCSLNEPLADVAGLVYFPEDGWIAQDLLGRGIPVWVDLAYMVFFGAFPYLLAVLLKRGTSRKTMWVAIGAFWTANLILELPLLNCDLYVYYGEQPFAVGGFPLFWLTINSLGAFAAAVVTIKLEPVLRGARQLVLVFVPFACYMSSWVVDMPGFWALNSDAPSPVKWIAVGASMTLGASAIDTLIRIGRSQPNPVPASIDQPVRAALRSRPVVTA